MGASEGAGPQLSPVVFVGEIWGGGLFFYGDCSMRLRADNHDSESNFYTNDSCVRINIIHPNAKP